MNDLDRLRAKVAAGRETRRDLQVIHALEHRERQVARHLEGVRFGALVSGRPDVAQAAECTAGPLPPLLGVGGAHKLFGVAMAVVTGMRYDFVGLQVCREVEKRDRGRRDAGTGWARSRDGVPYIGSGISVWHGYAACDSAPMSVFDRAQDLMSAFHDVRNQVLLMSETRHQLFFVTEHVALERWSDVRASG